MSVHDQSSRVWDSDGSLRLRQPAGGCPAKPPRRPLDNTTGIATTPVDPDTGEVQSWTYDPTLKWQLQSASRLALGGDHRIQVCYRHIRPDMSDVQIRERLDGGRPYLANLMTCGMVWVCPVCAAKVQAVRAREVRSAIDAWTATGGTVALMTTTVQHTRSDVLEDTLAGFKDAQRRLRQSGSYRRSADALGLVGTITGYEVTWGERNGWHPHAHSLLFLGAETEPGAVRAGMLPLWQRAAARAGLRAGPRAFDVRDGSAVRDYVTKLGTEYQWNAEHELVKSHSKRGKASGGMTPFDFLRRHLDDPQGGRWLALFAEFGYTFHGRNQLTWSRGLKRRLLGTEGATDEEVAASIGEADPVLAYLTLDDWRLVRRGNRQGELLQVAELAGREGVRHYLNHLRGD